MSLNCSGGLDVGGLARFVGGDVLIRGLGLWLVRCGPVSFVLGLDFAGRGMIRFWLVLVSVVWLFVCWCPPGLRLM